MTEKISEWEQENIEKRDHFLEYKREMKFIIGYLREIRENVTSKINSLEETIEGERPRIEDCNPRMKCETCDIYSMQFLERRPKEDKKLIYKCIICGGEQAD